MLGNIRKLRSRPNLKPRTVKRAGKRLFKQFKIQMHTIKEAAL